MLWELILTIGQFHERFVNKLHWIDEQMVNLHFLKFDYHLYHQGRGEKIH